VAQKREERREEGTEGKREGKKGGKEIELPSKSNTLFPPFIGH
jgi:hypothetical protein